MNGHPQLEDLDLYALSALDADERRALEAHLRACADCQHALEEARGRVALLALGAPAETPAPRVKQQLMERIRPKGIVRGRGGTLILFHMPSLLAAAAALLLFLGLVYLWRQNRQLGERIQELQAAAQAQQVEMAQARAVREILSAPDAVRVTLVAGQARPVPQGRAFYHPRKGLVFTAANLAALPPDKTYQLWLIPTEGKPITAGFFNPDAQGAGTILLPPLPEGVAAKAFAVTVEPAGGVPQPTGPIVLVGSAS